MYSALEKLHFLIVSEKLFNLIFLKKKSKNQNGLYLGFIKKYRKRKAL